MSPSFTLQKEGVKLVVTSRQGNEAVIEVLNGGSFFGETLSLQIGIAVRIMQLP